MISEFSRKWRVGLVAILLVLTACSEPGPNEAEIAASLHELHDETLLGLVSHLENIVSSDARRSAGGRIRVSMQYELVFDTDFADVIQIVADPGSVSETERARFSGYIGILGTVELTGMTGRYGEFEKGQRFDVARDVDFAKIKDAWIAQP